MAAPAPKALGRKIARLLWRSCAWLALAVGVYFLAGWAGSSVPRNAGWREPDQGVEILVETNGVHTAIVMPLVTPQKDWRTDFPASDIIASDQPYTHVSVSWGEREVFLDTPTWADLSPMTVLRVLAVGGDGLLHVAHYVRPAPDADHRLLRISTADYGRLVAQIERYVRPPDSRAPRLTHTGYAGYDVFYDAPGRYTAVHTCNQWTSDMLAGAGIRTGWWTPFAGGVMKWVPPLRASGQTGT